MKRFYKKNVFITGTNRGLGRVLVDEFASEGANIYAHTRTETMAFREEMSRVAEENGVRITSVCFDMTNTADMKKELQQIMRNQKGIDVLVNSAGVAHGGFIQGTPVQKIKDVFEVNFFSVIQLTQLVVKIMNAHKTQGSIINIASVAGFDLDPGNCAYGMSKSAIMSMTELMSKEYASLGIRVNAVAPGLLDTDMARQMEIKAKERMIDQSLMKRLGKPEEIAKVVMFLASDDASFISGQTIRVDGGQA